MSSWYRVTDPEKAVQAARLVAAWGDAPVINLEISEMILEIARDQVLAYAPALDVDILDTDIPNNYVYAQLKQAENLWTAGRVTSSGDVGMDSFSFTPRPLDKTIRTILRPVQGVPSVG